MKTTRWLFPLLGAFLCLVVGCNRSDRPSEMSREYYGVKVDWPQLDTQFANASPDVQGGVAVVKRAFRYALFPQAIVGLEKLSGNPSLTETQKKLVNDLIEQTKQVMAKAPPPPGQ